jgi:hypothetical protein
MKRRTTIALVAAAVISAGTYWFLSSEGICSDEVRIETPSQAIAFAKQQIVKRSGILSEAKAATGDDYIAGIERQPKCCGAHYGQQVISGMTAWSVQINAESSQYEHIVEFSRCRAVYYNGGLSWKKSEELSP